LIASIKGAIPDTLALPSLFIERIYQASERLYQRLFHGKFDALTESLLTMVHLSRPTFLAYAKEFSGAGLEKKVEFELGETLLEKKNSSRNPWAEWEPSGVLLHIAAGNVDFLPAYSVLEGLLAGNIDLLKFPRGNKDLSLALL